MKEISADRVMQVQDKDATKPEYYIALALEKFEIPFEFQYWIYGGSMIRGGLIVDFVIWNPFKQAVEYFGGHWHSGSLGADDSFKLAMEQQYFGSPTIVIYEGEAETPEQAEATARERLF